MSFKVNILLTLAIFANVVFSTSRNRLLKQHEIYTKCGSSCPVTCDNYENPPFCIQRCVVDYQCEDGYVRRSDGECVLTSECTTDGYEDLVDDPCAVESECSKPNAKFVECMSNCPLTCDNYENPPTCIESCDSSGYECDSGYVRRHDDGACVLESECPGPHEIFSNCTSNCPKTCDNYRQPQPPIYTQSCGIAGYECESGYVRSNDGACVLESECSKKNEKYVKCMSNCPLTCDNCKNPPKCIETCESSGYECESGYVRRDGDGVCVREYECPHRPAQLYLPARVPKRTGFLNNILEGLNGSRP